jgi:hypothetical protein
VCLFNQVPTHGVVLAASPHHGDVGDGAVADPSFMTIQHHVITVDAGGGLEKDRVRAVLGFGERESAELLDSG